MDLDFEQRVEVVVGAVVVVVVVVALVAALVVALVAGVRDMPWPHGQWPSLSSPLCEPQPCLGPLLRSVGSFPRALLAAEHFSPPPNPVCRPLLFLLSTTSLGVAVGPTTPPPPVL